MSEVARGNAAQEDHDDGPGPLLTGLLAALQGDPDAAAAALWAALSERARGPLGDVAGARRALDNPLFAPLSGHSRAEVAAWDRRGDAARTYVRVWSDTPVAAAFVVSARCGADGWRLTGLRRDDLPWS